MKSATVAVLAGILLAAQLAAQQRPAFRSTVVAVSVPLSIWQNRQPIRDLNASEIQLTDNGVLQEITVIDAVQTPLDLTIVLLENQEHGDHARSTFDRDLKAAIGQSVRPEDRIHVMLAGDGERERAWPVSSETLDATKQRGRCWPLFDVLTRAFVRRSDPEHQRVIILVSPDEGSGSVLTYEVVAEIARRSSARLYVVTTEMAINPPAPMNLGVGRAVCAPLGMEWNNSRRVAMRQIEFTPDPWEQDRQLWLAGKTRLTALARTTGGRSLDSSLLRGSFARPLQEALDEVRGSYILRYTPTGVAETGWHQLVVTINRPGRHDVRVRPGYQR